MIWLMKWLVFGHVHKWQTETKGPLTSEGGGRGMRYILRCECCGEVKKRDLI